MFGVGGRVFSPKRPKMGSVNSVLMRFPISLFRGGTDFKLQGGSRSPPLKAWGVTLPTLPMPTYAVPSGSSVRFARNG